MHIFETELKFKMVIYEALKERLIFWFETRTGRLTKRIIEYHSAYPRFHIYPFAIHLKFNFGK